MPLRPLGNTPLQVTTVGLGCNNFGGDRIDLAATRQVVHKAFDLGITLIDTADVYGNCGDSETFLGEVLGDRRKDIVLASKCGLPMDSAGKLKGASRHYILSAIDASLKRLKTDRIDLYLLHWRGSHPLAETVAAFEKLKEQGKIRHWGVSNLDTDDMEELGPGNCAANQVLYHPDSRGIEYDLLSWCARESVAVMAYSPLAHDTRRLLRSPALQQVAKRLNATPAQVALAWGMRHPHVISIPKASDPAHVRENAGAADSLKAAAKQIEQAEPLAEKAADSLRAAQLFKAAADEKTTRDELRKIARHALLNCCSRGVAQLLRIASG